MSLHAASGVPSERLTARTAAPTLIPRSSSSAVYQCVSREQEEKERRAFRSLCSLLAAQSSA